MYKKDTGSLAQNIYCHPSLILQNALFPRSQMSETSKRFRGLWGTQNKPNQNKIVVGTQALKSGKTQTERPLLLMGLFPSVLLPGHCWLHCSISAGLLAGSLSQHMHCQLLSAISPQFTLDKSSSLSWCNQRQGCDVNRDHVNWVFHVNTGHLLFSSV